MKPSIMLNQNSIHRRSLVSLVYILQIQKDKGNYKIIRTLPLTVQQTIISSLPPYVIRSENDLFSTTNSNSIIQNDEFLEPLKNNCFLHVIPGRESHCNAIFDNTTRIILIASNKIFINNGKDTQMKLNCGPHNRTLQGNFIITFYNCSVKIDDKVFVKE